MNEETISNVLKIAGAVADLVRRTKETYDAVRVVAAQAGATPEQIAAATNSYRGIDADPLAGTAQSATGDPYAIMWDHDPRSNATDKALYQDGDRVYLLVNGHDYIVRPAGIGVPLSPGATAVGRISDW